MFIYIPFVMETHYDDRAGSSSASGENVQRSDGSLLQSVQKMSTVAVNRAEEASDNDGYGTGHGDPHNSPGR